MPITGPHFPRGCGNTLAKRCSGRQHYVVCNAVSPAKRARQASRVGPEPKIVSVQPDGSDAWRLDEVVEILKAGGIGILPTDSLPAVVAAVENRDAVSRLYAALELAPKKPLSILVHSFSQISHYTLGFPVPQRPGQPDTFRLAQRVLPGPYTLILTASKALPSKVVDDKGRSKRRRSVGVRMPSDPVCRAVLRALDGALLSHSVHVPEKLAGDPLTEVVPDVGGLMDVYQGCGLDFIVDSGPRIATASTVIDFTGAEAELIRQGGGDATIFGL